jgi:hypothetical protein
MLTASFPNKTMQTSEHKMTLAPTQNRLAATLQRFVRGVSQLSGEISISAFSLAMLVFLVQEARAAALSLDGARAQQPEDGLDLDAVRQVFGESASDRVAGIDYAAIADAVAQIEQLYAQEPLAEDVSGAELAAQDVAAGAEPDASAQGLNAELDLVGRYLQDAVQYAQLSTGELAAEGGQRRAADWRGGRPGAGLDVRGLCWCAVAGCAAGPQAQRRGLGGYTRLRL